MTEKQPPQGNNSNLILKISSLVGITIVIALFLFCAHCQEGKQISKNQSEIEAYKTAIDSINMQTADRQFLDEFMAALETSEENKEDIAKLRQRLLKTPNYNKAIDTLLQQVRTNEQMLARNWVDRLLKRKNNRISEQLHASKQMVQQLITWQTKHGRPNFFLIFLIILLTGVFGGYARTRYDLLEAIIITEQSSQEKLKEIMKKADNLSNDMKTKSKAMASSSTATDLARETADMESIQADLSQLQDAPSPEMEREKLITSILYGVIASFLALLALNLADGGLLQFKEMMDYFIFAAWCLFFALFAKNQIEYLYRQFGKGGA